jgi:hypothetical protein
MMRNSENDEMAEKDYAPWIVNLALANYADTAILANMVNQYPNMPARAQYEFLLNGTRKFKRKFVPWPKKQGPDDIDLIAKQYNVNKTRAKEYLQLLSEEQLEVIRKNFETGGKK